MFLHGMTRSANCKLPYTADEGRDAAENHVVDPERLLLVGTKALSRDFDLVTPT